MNKLHKFSARWVVAAGLVGWAAMTAGAPSTPTTPAQPAPQPVNRAIVDGRHIQPGVGIFAPGQADISPTDARVLDDLYRRETQPRRFMPAD